MSARPLATAALLALAACGGAEANAPPKAASPLAPAKEESEPRTVEEAEAQIARLSAELGPKSPDRPSAPAESSAPPPPPGGDAKKSEDHLFVEACASPCRALTSMRRAVDALCRMTGEGDGRCVEARKTLADAVTRTASCKCG